MNKKAFSLIEISIVILIIGIVMAGTVQGNRLFKTWKISNAKSLTESSIVNSTQDLHIWLETTMKNSFDVKMKDGKTVSSWNNINPQDSRNYIDFAQGTTSYQPTFRKFGLNGIPAIDFDGSDNRLVADGVEFPYADYTMFFVFESDQNGNKDIFSAYSGSNYGMIIELEEGGLVRFLHRFPLSTSGGNDYNSQSFLQTNSPHIMTYVRDKSGSNSVMVRAEGVDQSPGSSSASGEAFSTLSMALGYLGSSSGFFDGRIAEVIIFSRALDSIEIDNIERYLSQKYSIKLAG